MSNVSGNGGRGRKKAVRKETKAGIVVPPSRVAKRLRERRTGLRVSADVSVFTAGVYDAYLGDILAGAVEARTRRRGKKPAPAGKRMVLQVKDVARAVDGDVEFVKLLKNATIAGGGVPEHKRLLKKN